MQEFVNVDFEFFDPKPTDYHGVRALLKSYLDDEEFDLPGLVNLIIAQTTVGSVIKTSEDDNPIGLLTVLGLERYKVRRYLVGVPPPGIQLLSPCVQCCVHAFFCVWPFLLSMILMHGTERCCRGCSKSPAIFLGTGVHDPHSSSSRCVPHVANLHLGQIPLRSTVQSFIK